MKISLVNLNKKYLAIVIIVTGIAVIIIGSYQYAPSSKENIQLGQNLEQGNQTITHQVKNYSIELHETVGVRANP